MKNEAADEMPRADHSVQLPYERANVRAVLAHYVFGRLLSGVSGIFVVVLLARHMGVIDYSRFATIAGLTGTVGILSSLGIEKAVACFVPQGRMRQGSDALSRFIWRMFAMRVVFLTAMTLALVVSLQYFSALPALPVGLAPLVAVLIIFMNLFQFLSLTLQSLVQQKTLARVLIIQWGGRLLLLMLILLSGPDVDLLSALIIMAAPDVIGSVVLLATLRQHLRDLHVVSGRSSSAMSAWPIWHDVRNVMRHNYGYSWLITPPQANTMVVIASLFLSVPQVAAYGFFVSIVERVRTYLPLQFMLSLAEPVLIAGYGGDRDFQNLCRRSNMLYKLNFVFLMLFFTIACAVTPLLTKLLTGGKYIEYSLFLPLLIAQITLGSQNTILQIIVNCVGRSDILGKSGAAALACMALAFGAFLEFGSNLLLLTTPLVFEVMNTGVAIFLLRRAGFTYNWQGSFHLRTGLAAALAFVVTQGVQDYIAGTLLQIVVAGLTATFIFGVAGKLFRIMRTEELLAAWSFLRSRQPTKG